MRDDYEAQFRDALQRYSKHRLGRPHPVHQGVAHLGCNRLEESPGAQAGPGHHPHPQAPGHTG